MIETDSRLDARLRSFYEHIEEQPAPAGLDRFDATQSRTRRRALNIVLGSAAIAAVAVAGVAFALELQTHRSGTVHPATHATPAATPFPSYDPGPRVGIPNDPIANPSFEEPPASTVTPVTSLPGWTVSGRVQLIPLGTIGLPDGGYQYLVLMQGGRSPGEITQRVKTVAGVNYEVIFSTGTNPECVGSGVVDVYWNGRFVLGISTTPSGDSTSSPEDLHWSTDAFASGLATGTTSTVGFMADGACGAALDQVIMQAQPVPGA